MPTRYRPTHLPHGLLNGPLPFPVHKELSLEIRVHVYIVSYRDGKRQQHRYCQHSAIYRQAKVSQHAIHGYDASRGGNKRHDNPSQGTCYQEQDEDGYKSGDT